MNITFPDEFLAEQWDSIDWDAAAEKLALLQEKLTIAAFGRKEKTIRKLQYQIVNEIDIKCLAVRHVVASTSGPGIDGVRWRTSAEKMRAAIALIPKDYKAQHMRQILLVVKNTGKERRPRLPTYFDRAMNVLYGYALIPVVEAQAERKSFAFRQGRSSQDAHAYVLEALKGNSAPEYVVCADIKSYFASIQHSWLLEHAPMDKKILAEFLRAGYVFAGELFPSDGEGISEGSNLSPYLGNFVLDGLQKYIYRGLYGTSAPQDYADGNLIRFADDIRIFVRTKEKGERAIELLEDFLAERGLRLSPEKTMLCNINEGMTFLSRTYIRKGGHIYSYPSDAAVERFIAELREVIQTNTKSQRALIETLNKKLKGWGAYHRYSDAEEAFRRVDAAVQTALLDAAMAKHPKLPRPKVISRYWYRESDGRHSFALPDDKSVRVTRLADTILLQHSKVKTNANPFVERDYTESRGHERAIKNVTGPYKAIWERQNGRCHYCGRPILGDQVRTIVQLDIGQPPSVKNSAYIHKICAINEFELIRTAEDITSMRPYDVLKALEEISDKPEPGTRRKREINEKWKHYGFKKYLSDCTAASVMLTFREIEELDGQPMAASARKSMGWWSPRTNCNTIAEAWLTEGYVLHNLDLEKEKITLRRKEEGIARLQVPRALLEKKIPENAIFELETHMDYIIKKYGL